jgi:hypothetical protein
MIAFGNICLCVAAIVYLWPLQRMLNTTPNLNGTYAGVAVLLSVVFVSVPLWLCLTSSLIAATARGGFDWLFAARPPQYAFAVLASFAIAIATAYSLLGRFVTPPELPASARWLSMWAAHVFPPVAMLFCAVVLNARLFSWMPQQLVRIPFCAVAAVSVLVGCGLLVERSFGSQQRRIATATEEAAATPNDSQDESDNEE